MKKPFLLLIFLISFLWGLSQQAGADWFSIKAFLPGWNGAVVELTANGTVLHMDVVKKDLYSYTGTFTGNKEGLIKLKKGKTQLHLPLFIERGVIKVRDGGSQQLAVYGTPLNDTYVLLNRQFDSLTRIQNGFNFDEARQFKRTIAVEYIRKHPQSLISLQLLKDHFYLEPKANDTLYYQLFHSLDSSLQKTSLGRKLQAEVIKRNTVAIGRVAPNLQLTDTTGTVTELYQKGGYTLIDFWASWCGPCRREHPSLKRVYHQFASKGFNITGVSLDVNKFYWLKAIQQDGLPWKQVNDPKGWAGYSALMYNIKTVPMNFLVNREGVIVAKNIDAIQLEKILAQYLP